MISHRSLRLATGLYSLVTLVSLGSLVVGGCSGDGAGGSRTSADGAGASGAAGASGDLSSAGAGMGGREEGAHEGRGGAGRDDGVAGAGRDDGAAGAGRDDGAAGAGRDDGGAGAGRDDGGAGAGDSAGSGGRTAGAGAGNDPGSLESVEARLDALGVAMPTLDELGPMLRDRSGRTLADGAHPLKKPVSTLAGPSELVVIGTAAGDAVVVDLDRAGSEGLPAHVIHEAPGDFGALVAPVVLALHADADGREETLVVDLRDEDPQTGEDVVLWQLEDEAAGFEVPFGAGQELGEWRNASHLAAARYDAEGDGLEEVFLVALVGEEWEYRVLQLDGMEGPTLGPIRSGGPVLDPSLSGEALTDFDVASGQLDGDPELEVALVINTRPDPQSDYGHSRLVVLDDDGGGLGVVLDQLMVFEGSTPFVASGVGFADVDADFVDEIVVAGTDVASSIDNYTQLLAVLEDMVEPSAAFDMLCEGSVTPATQRGDVTVRIGDTQVNTARVTGGAMAGPDAAGFEPAEDVLVNNVLWQWTASEGVASPSTSEQIPLGTDSSIIVSSETLKFAFGNLDGDALTDVAVLTMGDGYVTTVGSGPLVAGTLYKISVGGASEQQTRLDLSTSAPVAMAPANVDGDAIVVEYLPEEHGIRYSEPVILAVLAAPPCYAGPLGQNTGNCSTTFGATTNSEAATSESFSLSASLHVGMNVEERVFTQSEIEAVQTIEATTVQGTDSSASLSFTKVYTNGSSQDQVLATVLAYEQFAYRILDAPPGPSGESRVGQTIAISIPRDDAHVTRLFSEDIIRPAMRPSQRQALDAVFRHTPTEPLSYLRPSQLDAHLQSLRVIGQACDEETDPSLIDDCAFITHRDRAQTPVVSGPLSGVGSGQSGVLAIGSTSSSWRTWNVTATRSLQVTAGGVLAGFSVSAGAEATMTVTHGDVAEYGFEIGAVDPEVYEPYSAAIYAFNYHFDCTENPDGEGECDGFQVLSFTVQ